MKNTQPSFRKDIVTCRISGEEFFLSEEEMNFRSEFELPLPTLCPEERLRRRMQFRNFNNLYHRNCDLTGSKILSMYDLKSKFPVYSHQAWWSDAWDAKTYARQFDPNQSFFDQYHKLSDDVPRAAVVNTNCENCEYSNFAFHSKDCYLIFGCVSDQNCLYGHIVWECENCVDTLYAYQCQWCSNSLDIVGCYDLHFSSECINCQESYFLHDCRNCQNCYGCVGLRNKKYYWNNLPLTKSEYLARISHLRPLSTETIGESKRKLAELKASFPSPALFGSQNETVSGNHLYFCKDAEHCFDIKRSESVRYCFTIFGAEHSQDLSFGSGRFSYEGVAVLNSSEAISCHTVSDCHAIAYSEFCYNSRDLFGCIGLRNSQYCIFNQQYSKEDYSELRGRIVAHMRRTSEWGEFFPTSLSPFAYNESVAQQYLPLDRTTCLQRGLGWKEELETKTNAPIEKLSPPPITEASDEILKQTFCCANSGKAYRVIKPELEFYRRVGIALPQICPQERLKQMMNLRAERKLWNRHCNRCETAIQSAEPANSPKEVLCEPCYLECVQG